MLVKGTASAAVITATDSTTNPGAGTIHHHLSPEAIISSLEQKGVDVSGVQAALQIGDAAAVRAWLENYFQSRKPDTAEGTGHQRFDLNNVTQQQETITQLEERGVDGTGVKADLQNGDITSVHTWLKTYFDAHKGEMPPGHHPGHARPASPTGTSP